MLNLLIVLLGLLILVLSVALGIVMPVSRAAAATARGHLTPDGKVPGVQARHISGGVLGTVIGAVILVIGLSGPLVEVPAGNVGVVTNFGQVQVGTLEPGLHFVMPIVQHVVNIDTRVQPHQFQEIDAASK